MDAVTQRPSSIWGTCSVKSDVSGTVLHQSHTVQSWKRVFDGWRKALPLSADLDSNLGSWLFCRSAPVNGWTDRADRAARHKVRFGCKACHLAGVKSPLARCEKRFHPAFGGRLTWFKKHAASETHLRAVSTLTCSDRDHLKEAQFYDKVCAPSHEWFSEVWKTFRAGKGVGTSIVELGQSRKLQRGAFCLAEAMRALDRDHLRNSKSWASHTDGKCKVLTMRFCGTTLSLQRRVGMLGMVDYVAIKTQEIDAAMAVKSSIEQILKQFCTWGCFAPPLACGAQPYRWFDAELFEHLKGTHEIFDTDADRVMILSGMELTQSFQDDVIPFFPNNVVQVRDHTHGARRMHSGMLEFVTLVFWSEPVSFCFLSQCS